VTAQRRYRAVGRRRVPLLASTSRIVKAAAIAAAPRRPLRHDWPKPIFWAIANAATATPNVTRKNPTKRTAPIVPGTPDRGAPGDWAGRERGRGRVTGSRRQSRRRGASATAAVPPTRCIRAGPLVRGRPGVLGGRSGSTCDASVSAIGPCSQRRRLGWIRRYPLVKDGSGPRSRNVVIGWGASGRAGASPMTRCGRCG